MKKYLNIIGFLILFIFISIVNVNASECSNSEYKELKELSKKIEVNYLFDKNNKVFNVNIYNLSDKFNISLSNGMYMFGSNSPKREIGIFEPGSNFKISIYTTNKTNCPEELYNTIKVSIPYYNKYSEYKECNNYYNIDICKKWYNTTNITEEQFKNKINELNSNNQNRNLINTITDFVINNWMFVLPILLVIIILIIFMIKKIKKNKEKNINFEIK